MIKKILLSFLLAIIMLFICIVNVNANVTGLCDWEGEDWEEWETLIENAWNSYYSKFEQEQWGTFTQKLIERDDIYYYNNEITDEKYMQYLVAYVHINEIKNYMKEYVEEEIHEEWPDDEFKNMLYNAFEFMEQRNQQGIQPLSGLTTSYIQNYENTTVISVRDSIIQMSQCTSANEILENFSNEQIAKALYNIYGHLIDIGSNRAYAELSREETKLIELLQRIKEGFRNVELTNDEIEEIYFYVVPWDVDLTYRIDNDTKIYNIIVAILERYDNIYDIINQNTTPDRVYLKDIIQAANSFFESGRDNGNKISSESLQILSKNLYNILFQVGILIAFIIGGILGIKFITSGLEGKAQVKEMLLPYIIGCIVLFSAFGIWKLVVIILQS